MFNREFFLQLMKKAGDSQASLAKALGLHTSTLNRRINGKLEFYVTELIAISKRYQLSEPVLSALFFGDEKTKTKTTERN